jgi:hypothetical protein
VAAEHPESRSDVTPEQRRKVLDDPEVKARIREIQQELRRGAARSEGIGQDKLADLLREHGA